MFYHMRGRQYREKRKSSTYRERDEVGEGEREMRGTREIWREVKELGERG